MSNNLMLNIEKNQFFLKKLKKERSNLNRANI